MKKQELKKLQIYIDGSCRPTTKIGAYAALAVYDNKEKKIIVSGKVNDVTNNIMELTALIEALKYIKDNNLDNNYDIEIFSDSQYVVNGVTQWWSKWAANNFTTSANQKVKNLELWKILIKLSNEVRCRLTWIKGHANNLLHNEVDAIVFKMTDFEKGYDKPSSSSLNPG